MREGREVVRTELGLSPRVATDAIALAGGRPDSPSARGIACCAFQPTRGRRTGSSFPFTGWYASSTTGVRMWTCGSGPRTGGTLPPVRLTTRELVAAIGDGALGEVWRRPGEVARCSRLRGEYTAWHPRSARKRL